MATTAENKSKNTVSDVLIAALSKYRTVIVGVVVALFAALLGVALFVAVSENVRLKAIAGVEAFASRYDDLSGVQDEAKRADGLAVLTEELAAFAAKSSGYAAARAFAVLATIAADAKDWTKAEEMYLKSANAAGAGYLAPIGLYNAASAAEERGDNTRAIELYTKCADGYSADFPMAPRAYFAVGRLNEAAKDFAAAEKAYRKIVETWPSDNWTKFANGRIMAIAALGGI